MNTQKIELSEIKPEKYLDLINAIVLILDVDGNVIHINKKGVSVLGYDVPEKIVGRNWFDDFIPSRYIGKLKSVFSRMMAGEFDASEFYGNPVKRKDGSERDIFWHNSYVNSVSGDIIGLMSAGEDVTDRKRIEAEMIKSQKLESLSLLSGGIAHDFNNLLAVIEGNISLAKILEKDKSIKKYLSDSEKSCERAKRLTSELLIIARGTSSLKKIIDLKEAVEGAALISLCGSRYKPELSLCDESILVEADIAHLEQTLDNVIKNAKEAMPSGGIIKFSIEKILMEKRNQFLLAPGDYAKISISDSGVGIPTENMKRIFDPYFSTKARGLGFGLATAFSIVIKHGGYIDVKSELGAGTEVIIYLPVSTSTIREELVPDLKKHGKIPNKLNARIIVMDDEAMIQQMIGHILEHYGCEVRCAYDGREALSIYRECMNSKTPVDLVIMDLTIPGGIGGVETIRELLSYDPGAKAIISSGYSHDFVMSDYKKHGFKGVILKPYTAKELKEVVYNAINISE